MTLRVALLVYDGFDLLDAGAPYEVFLTASRLLERDGGAAVFEVVLATPGGGDVTALGGMTLTRLHDATTLGVCDVIVVPGTVDVACALADSTLVAAIETLSGRAAVTSSVCTGAFLLARAGLLDGLEATTHWEDLADLASCGEVAGVVPGVRWVDEGAVVTAGGLASGLHMALHLVARLHSVELARRTARQLDVDWDPAPAR
ncbi:DJ-1/PfpI family protein [Demequina pelophila]|uniref:DJ-1/PfpI family protein n=1 Tax=Demequina pelophila TaxID=1638984 RepID=UPI00078484F7|nr:DJ-1/PfpI family protein [Demequina pelophila]